MLSDSMVVCPDCGYGNFAGSDECEQCGQSLVALTKPRARSAVEHSIIKDRIEKLSPSDPVCVDPNTTVGEVLNLLVDHRIGCVIVAEDRKIAGIFSERDALNRIGSQAAEFAGRPISEFMTPDPHSLELTDRIAYALHQMDLGGFRHVPILSGGEVAGVISIRDILRHITDRLSDA